MAHLKTFEQFSEQDPLRAGVKFNLISNGQIIGRYKVMGYKMADSEKVYYTFADLLADMNLEELSNNSLNELDEYEIMMMVEDLDDSNIGPLLKLEGGAFVHPYYKSYKIEK